MSLANHKQPGGKLDGYSYYAFSVIGVFITWYKCNTLNNARYLVSQLKMYKPDYCGYNDERMTWQNCLDYSAEHNWIAKLCVKPIDM